MKIQKELPMFENQSVLFITAGSHDGMLYLAGDGSIKKISSFRVKKPKYSDKEGFLKTSLRSSGGKGTEGRNTRSGSVRELDRREENRAFLQELKTSIANAAKQYVITDVYLFIPPALKEEALSVLPAKLLRRLRQRVVGNYHEHHPFELIRLAQKKAQALPVTMMSSEARSLVNRTSQKQKS